MLGIDVSHHNGQVNWKVVRAGGTDFAFMKATEGDGFVDASFADNWQNARDAGVLRGAYHFFSPLVDPAAQAAHFIATVGALLPGDLPPVIDVESGELDQRSPGELLDALGVWLGQVKSALGLTPIIYTGRFIWQDRLGGSARFADHPLWIAQYTSASKPTLPSGFPDWLFWQFSEDGKASGISGNVDPDRFNGDLVKLRALTKSA